MQLWKEISEMRDAVEPQARRDYAARLRDGCGERHRDARGTRTRRAAARSRRSRRPRRTRA